jgi:hypothetical protein
VPARIAHPRSLRAGQAAVEEVSWDSPSAAETAGVEPIADAGAEVGPGRAVASGTRGAGPLRRSRVGLVEGSAERECESARVRERTLMLSWGVGTCHYCPIVADC